MPKQLISNPVQEYYTLYLELNSYTQRIREIAKELHEQFTRSERLAALMAFLERFAADDKQVSHTGTLDIRRVSGLQQEFAALRQNYVCIAHTRARSILRGVFPKYADIAAQSFLTRELTSTAPKTADSAWHSQVFHVRHATRHNAAPRIWVASIIVFSFTLAVRIFLLI